MTIKMKFKSCWTEPQRKKGKKKKTLHHIFVFFYLFRIHRSNLLKVSLLNHCRDIGQWSSSFFCSGRGIWGGVSEGRGMRWFLLMTGWKIIVSNQYEVLEKGESTVGKLSHRSQWSVPDTSVYPRVVLDDKVRTMTRVLVSITPSRHLGSHCIGWPRINDSVLVTRPSGVSTPGAVLIRRLNKEKRSVDRRFLASSKRSREYIMSR